jgi:hypothetical protein
MLTFSYVHPQEMHLHTVHMFSYAHMRLIYNSIYMCIYIYMYIRNQIVTLISDTNLHMDSAIVYSTSSIIMVFTTFKTQYVPSLTIQYSTIIISDENTLVAHMGHTCIHMTHVYICSVAHTRIHSSTHTYTYCSGTQTCAYMRWHTHTYAYIQWNTVAHTLFVLSCTHTYAYVEGHLNLLVKHEQLIAADFCIIYNHPLLSRAWNSVMP